MDAFDCMRNPFRRPGWRAERVMQLVEHQQPSLRPRFFDDHYVQAYRLFLIQSLVAGADKDQRDAAILEYPQVCQAHRLYWQPDTERRLILEARLLTSESFAQIAERFATEPSAIDYYEKLFFNVRDRLQSSDWIAKVIRGQPDERDTNPHGVMTAAQRGYVYRLFGYYGGPLVLDAMIAGLAPDRRMLCGEDIADWFDDAMAQLVRSRAVAAAGILDVDRNNVMRVLKLALSQQRAAASTKAGRQTPNNLDDSQLEEHLEAFVSGMNGWKLSEMPKTFTAAAMEPPAGK
jgi:hypothetical protein